MEANKKIEGVDNFEKNYHSCLRSVITLSGVMSEPVVIKFVSESRKNTSYTFNTVVNDNEVNYSDSAVYGKGIGMGTRIMKHLDEVLSQLDIVLSDTDRQAILKTFDKALDKCESRFGNSVVDYNENMCDAMVTITAVDNGKPKHKVKIFNHDWNKDTPEDYSVGVLKGRSIYVIEEDKEYVVWLIEKDSITLQDLLLHLMCEFENPYLIIEPTLNLDIILDFKLKSELYDGTI